MVRLNSWKQKDYHAKVTSLTFRNVKMLSLRPKRSKKTLAVWISWSTMLASLVANRFGIWARKWSRTHTPWIFSRITGWVIESILSNVRDWLQIFSDDQSISARNDGIEPRSYCDSSIGCRSARYIRLHRLQRNEIRLRRIPWSTIHRIAYARLRWHSYDTRVSILYCVGHVCRR